MSEGRCDLSALMRFEPAAGVVDLDRHLERLKAAAAARGISFDRHAARNIVHAAAFHLDQAMLVRLLVSPMGDMVMEMTPAAPADRDAG